LEQVSSTARSNQLVTSTVTVGSNVSTSQSQSQLVFNGPFTVLSTTGTSLPCEFWTYNFTATTGQYVSGNFTSDNPISFYVIPASRYQTWFKTGSCGNVGDAIASQLTSTSYSFNSVAMPNAGTWMVVLVNSSNARNADGYLSIYLSTSSYTVTQVILSTITTGTTAASTVSGQGTGIAGFPVTAIVIGIIAGLVAVVILRRRTLAQNDL
jgi:hypothetical protein